MLETLGNTFRVPDLRRRLLITVLLLCVCRVGVYIPIPGADMTVAKRHFDRPFEGDAAEGGVMALIDMFSGGALWQAAVFGLGIMPYISASIIFQLLASVIPALEKMQKEGEAGRRKINQYTRYATVVLCLVQAAIMIASLKGGGQGGEGIFPADFGFGSTLMAALLMTAGTMLLMWIGEQIDEFGIGNGISLIIMINIISRMPTAIRYLYDKFEFTLEPDASRPLGIQHMALLVALFIFVNVAIILITQGQRRIPFQQAKQMRGRRVYGGVKHYLPLQVNSAGVIPIIFAQSLLMFPSIFVTAAARKFETDWDSPFFYRFFEMLRNGLQMGSFVYEALYVGLIFFFCYFWTAIQFNPTDMANNLRDHGSFIPGYRPGKRTADYLENVMTRITLPGAAFLSIVAVAPSLMYRSLNLPWVITSFYGGTGLLIVVGVALDLVKKIEQQLLMRHYDGFTRRRRH